MLNSLSYSDVANEMSMLRSAFKGTFLVVEGSSDSRLYTKFIDMENVRIIVAHSKNNVTNAVNEMKDRRKERRILGIVDRDMETMLGKKRSPPIFCTDRRDMESTIMSTRALDSVLSEFADTSRRGMFQERYGPIGDAVARSASALGHLMYISYRKGMNLSFKDIDHTLFINPRSLEVDIPKMVATVYGSSMSRRYPRGAIADLVSSALEETGGSWDIARGHDAVAILRLGLRNSFGSYNSKNISDGELGGALRIAYDRELFMESRLFEETRQWCEKNGLVLWLVS